VKALAGAEGPRPHKTAISVFLCREIMNMYFFTTSISANGKKPPYVIKKDSIKQLL